MFAVAEAQSKTVSVFLPRLVGIESKGARSFAIQSAVVLLRVAFDQLELDGDIVRQVAKVQLTRAKIVLADVKGVV